MPLYEFGCPKCLCSLEKILPINALPPKCPICDVPMIKHIGNLAFIRMKGEIQGSTPGIRKKAEEITKKKRSV